MDYSDYPDPGPDQKTAGWIRNYEEMKTRAEKAEEQLAQARELLREQQATLGEAMSVGFNGCLTWHTRGTCPGCNLKRKVQQLRTEWRAHLESEGNDECKVNPVASNVCSRGTKSCQSQHGKDPNQ